jgi:hypothetical protein
MNEEMKRLIDLLNNAGYTVTEIAEGPAVNKENQYVDGFKLTIFKDGKQR